MMFFKKGKILSLSFIFFMLCILFANAQWGYTNTPVTVIVAADHEDWNYSIGKTVNFNVQVLRHGNPVKGIKISYEVMPEKMEPILSESITLSSGTGQIKAGTMKKPGFLRCTVTTEVDGERYTGMATAAFDPFKIEPTTMMPSDFEEFWNRAKIEAAKIPMLPEMELIPELSDGEINVYNVNIQNYRANAKLYGVLSVPKKPGKYPAILKVPGAGVWGHFMVQDEHVKKRCHHI